jgi:hypothetical protein
VPGRAPLTARTGPPIDSATRRAALIATAVTVPVVVVVGLLLGGAGSQSGGSSPSASGTVLPAVSVGAPSDSSGPTVSTCAQVISALPLRLAGLDLRRTTSNPPSSSIVAWGDPAIVLRCGVSRPANLNASLSAELFEVNTVLVLPDKGASSTTFTVVDRSVYLDVTVPSSYSQPPLGPIMDALKKVLPKPVCVQDASLPRAEQCTRRK